MNSKIEEQISARLAESTQLDNIARILDTPENALTDKQKEYQEYFEKKMKEWGIDSLEELDEEKLRQFFEDVDEGWYDRSEDDDEYHKDE